MKKSELFTHKVNAILSGIEFEGLESQREMKSLQDSLCEAFVAVYGNDSIRAEDCKEDEGFALIPALIKDSELRVYVGLIDVCVKEQGQHHGTTIFTVEGIKEQQEEEEEFKRFVTYPYKYAPLIEIVGDIHTHTFY